MSRLATKTLALFDELEKIAIRRAAKEIIKGTLSPRTEVAARRFLKSPEIMSKGLARGSENIAKRLGYTIHSGGLIPTFREGAKAVGEAVRGVAKKKPSLKDMPNKFLAELKRAPSARGAAGSALATTLAPSLGGGGTIPNLRMILMQPGVKRFRSIAGKAGKGLSKKDQSYLQELIKRHEIDEARMAFKGVGWSLPGKPMPLTKGHIKLPGGAHLDPEVLLREAYHTRLAPKKVRGAMSAVREATKETPGMFDVAGFRYGKEALLPGTKEYRRAATKLRETAAAHPKFRNLFLSPEAESILQESRPGVSPLRRGLSALRKLRSLPSAS